MRCWAVVSLFEGKLCYLAVHALVEAAKQGFSCGLGFVCGFLPVCADVSLTGWGAVVVQMLVEKFSLFFFFR